MTPESNELEKLWNSGPDAMRRDPQELLRKIEQRTRSFDRTILRRDLREAVAGVLVAGIFLAFAVYDHSWLERAAHLWLAACGVWVILHMRRYANAGRRPAPEESLKAYQDALLARYDRQIELLRRAKYWYVLPFWVGFLFSGAATAARTHNGIVFAAMAVFATLLSGAIWWLNEGVGVRYLLNTRAKLETAISS
jgi:hypothetical protein